MDIDQQVVAITGGGSGIGESTARYLAERGAKVAVLDWRKDQADQVAADIGGLSVQCDVRDEDSSQAAVAAVYEAVGIPRVVINCAGIGVSGRIVGKQGPMPLVNFTEVISINLVGTFNMMRLFGELMTQLEPLDDGERGVFINTASVAAFDGQIGQCAYSASKAGLVGMTLPAAREFAQFGIRVMTIAPGPVSTPLMNMASDEVKQGLLANMQFPKRFAQPDEYASLALQIITNVSLNGETIRMDCGVRMPPR